MSTLNEQARILRIAAWIWIGFLVAMLIMDSVLLLPVRLISRGQQGDLWPVFLYYISSFFVALIFLGFTFWDGMQDLLGKYHYPLMLLIITVAPILVNSLVVPRFPPGQLSNAEGLALRQLPIQFVALALIAWKYDLASILLFSIGTSALDLFLTLPGALRQNNFSVHVFIAIIRTISFIAAGVFINQLVAQLRAQRESLREANANLTHYASTLEQLTVSCERNRLARELHDTLAHSLTALSVSLEAAKAYFDIDKEKTRELLDTSLESTRKGVDETRRALKSLRSSDLEDLGLGLSLQNMAQSAALRFNLDLELGLPALMPSLSPDVEQTIHRVAQEAIQNIVKHSGASKFSLRLEHSHNTTLTIEDNGTGFDTSKALTGHFGLVGMRERAELADGTLTIESTKGKGTKVVLRI